MTVTISPQARADLVDIFVQSAEGFELDVADARIDALSASIRGLESFPRAGQLIHTNPEIRRLVVRPHIILYGVNSDDVRVARVIDGRRDITSILDGITED